MKSKPIILMSVAGLVCWALFLAQTGKPFWIALSLVLFLGIFLLDKSERVLGDEINLGLFTGICALVILAFCEKTAEDFWRVASGAVFMMAILYEYNFGRFNRGGLLKTAFVPALAFFVSSQCQSLRFLEPEQALSCDLFALMSLVFFELPIFNKSKAQAMAFSPVSAARLGVSGLFSIYYLTNFVPSIVHQDPFRNLFIIFPIVGIVISGVSLLVRNPSVRYVFFAANLSLLVAWAALIGEEAQLTGAVLSSLGAAFSSMVGAMSVPDEDTGKKLFLKITPWAFPGTVMFTFLVLIFYPTTQLLVSEGAALWAVTILTSWIGGVSFGEDGSEKNKNVNSSIRVRVAIACSALGGPLLPAVPQLVAWVSKNMAAVL